MSNSKICPKCQSALFVRVDNSRGQQLNPIKTGVFTVAEVSRYVCCDCGFVEEWIENHDDLKKIKEKHI